MKTLDFPANNTNRYVCLLSSRESVITLLTKLITFFS